MMEVVIALKEQDVGVVDIDSGEEEAEKAVKGTKKKKACDPHKKRACLDCTKRCARIHGRFSSSPSKARPVVAVPSFFKVMVGYFSEDMEIPPPFAKTILDLAGSNIYLEDSFGLRWRVRVCLRDGVLSFGHGWKNFVLDHAVSCGEFLVFRQIARSVFAVQMFASSAVERLYLCERNKRLSRKRKPRQIKSSPGVQTVKMNKKNGESSKKKLRTDHEHNQIPIDCKLSDEVCIDDSDAPDSASEQKYSETSEKAPQAGAAGSEEVSRAFTRHQDDVQRVLDGQIEIAGHSTIFTEHAMYDDTAETANVEGSSLPANVDASGPLAMMDLNEASVDDVYLPADIYEFDSDTFPVDLNKEGLVTHGQTSGSNCLEHGLPDQNSCMGVGQGSVMLQVLPCIENNMVDAPETYKAAANVAEHDIEINVLPAKEPLSLGEDNSSPPTNAEVQLSECPLGSCDKDKCSFNGNKEAQKEDEPQDGQANMQSSTEQHAAEIMPNSSKTNELPHLQEQTDNNSGDLQTGSTGSSGVLALSVNKFCVAVPPPDQTWLELPSRLPAIPRTKKQGRKVVILKDPCMRLWPVLYQCTPRFSGFVTGWVDICRENRLREGDACEFELSGNYELSFQVRNSHCCPAT
ncbi:hypothetical protein PR202_ga08587 [Eleusine coracana subsp. coracana]|uniref:TF-B3 domain-containing protein n=1 Tax=Eleusine coracana subsp. coracana TaxID=191504 RepID=A0AAV5C1T2_ELECO|nr:hypothetical protein PR202_ga08587 [Eleusine coracana subsp. coracana]